MPSDPHVICACGHERQEHNEGGCGVLVGSWSDGMCPCREFTAGDAEQEHPIRIPKDPEARARLAQMAGLTDEERLALDKWCALQQAEYEARCRQALERFGDAPMGSSDG